MIDNLHFLKIDANIQQERMISKRKQAVDLFTMEEGVLSFRVCQ
jgi:hypothetical protein